MKRIKDRERFLRNQERTQRRSERKYRYAHHGAFGKSHLVVVPAVTSTGVVIAPLNFSLIDNPEGSIAFIAQLEAAARREESIFIDLAAVKQLTVDALLLLLSKMRRKSGWKCRKISGNEPTDKSVRNAFVQSGFYAHVSNKRYRKEDDHGVFKKHAGKKVREDICLEIVCYATKSIYGESRKNGGLYRALIECMANTRDHASLDKSDTERWWVSAYANESSGVVYFAFLDTGVGVFKSVKMQGFLRQLGKFFGVLTYADLLKDLLNGEIGSRTGLPYRGKGLPAIRKAQERGQIRNLKILTNTAYLDSATGIGRLLNNQKEFRGTCLTWELHRE